MAGIALVQAVTRELAIKPGRIDLVSRAGLRFEFVIAVPPDRDDLSLAEIIRASSSLDVTALSVVALPGTATATTTMIYVNLPNPAWPLSTLALCDDRGAVHVKTCSPSDDLAL